MKTVSVVMIVKNEEALLARCLESVKDADEIIICDTGSEDGTIDIAKRYTDKVFTDFVWCDDFSKARNHAKSKATKDWVLSIDADEFLSVPFQQVRDTVAMGVSAIDCTMIAETGAQTFQFPRLFRNAPEIQWVRMAHNHINVYGETVGDVRITFGYSPAHRKDPGRTMRILEKSLKADPRSARDMFYLGREYWYAGRHDDTVIMMGRYVQLSDFIAEKAEAFYIMSRAYYAMGMPNDARDALAQALILNANFKEALEFMAVLAGDGRGNPRWQRNADQWKRLAGFATNEDVLFVRT